MTVGGDGVARVGGAGIIYVHDRGIRRFLGIGGAGNGKVGVVHHVAVHVKHQDVGRPDARGARGDQAEVRICGGGAGEEVRIDESVGIPAGHLRDKVGVVLLHAGVFHLSVLDVEQSAPQLGGNAVSDGEIVGQTGIGHQQGRAGADLVFEGRQHVVVLVIGDRHLHVQLFQIVLPDDGTHVHLCADFKPVALHDGAAVGVSGALPVLVAGQNGLEVGHQIVQIGRHIHGHAVLQKLVGVVVIGACAEDHIREITRRHHQGKVRGGGFRVGDLIVDGHTGALRQFLGKGSGAGAFDEVGQHRRPGIPDGEGGGFVHYGKLHRYKLRDLLRLLQDRGILSGGTVVGCRGRRRRFRSFRRRRILCSRCGGGALSRGAGRGLAAAGGEAAQQQAKRQKQGQNSFHRVSPFCIFPDGSAAHGTASSVRYNTIIRRFPGNVQHFFPDRDPETAPQAGIPKDGGRAKRAAAVS